MDDKTVNTLEGFLYSSLKKGVSKSVLEQFLMDELDAAIETYETETAYAKQVDALGAALEPFYEYLHTYYEPLTKHITREEFEESLFAFITKLQTDPAYVRLFFNTFTGKEVPKVENKDAKTIYNFLKDNNLN